ncbi:amidohydrolase family protein [Nocardioides sp. Bht2]|uniref:amidohydrolase family protein n=1 Tax=Nocardioides sp. Bht2 TaxID=3392297 RepID=UPI0039B5F9F5
MTLWLRNVEVRGESVDVAIRRGRVAAIRPPGRAVPADAELIVDGDGGALIPGLHDHHLHLLSFAAALTSLDCAGSPDLASLGVALRAADQGDDWVRGIGYDASVLGPLDRHVLDSLEPKRPVRIQHRSGALWVLNTPALDRVAAALDESGDVERDAHGEPTGRLWRYDSRLAPVLPRRAPALAAVGRRLRSFGITGVTDATPDLDADALQLLSNAAVTGVLPVRITSLATGATGATGATEFPGIEVGPAKLLLHDHDLPDLDELTELIRQHHQAKRPVAVHCVTAESLLLTLAALEAAGPLPGDRVEHASVVPYGVEPELARFGVRVVTQPGFLTTRGERYRTEVDPADLAALYPVARLLAAGIPVACSSDAPFGLLDPWQVMASATERLTEAGRVLGSDERVNAAVALSGYLTPPSDPGGTPRRIEVGMIADLTLLRAPLAEVLRAPTCSSVRGTVGADVSQPAAGWMES